MKYVLANGLTKVMFHWVVLFPLIPAACLHVAYVTSPAIFQGYYAVQGKILNKKHVIKTIQFVNEHSTCMMNCESHMDCYSINFYPGRNICELNNATHLSHPDGYVEDLGGTFLLNFFRAFGWCSDKLCAGTGKRCSLNSDKSNFICKDHCTDALGLEDRRIPDSALTASSAIPSSQPTSCRLRNNDEWGAGTNGIGQFLQVDLNGVFKVTGIATQGHYQYLYWVTKYKIAYRIKDNRELMFYEENGIPKIFDGNFDKSSVVTNSFTIGIVARYIRIVIQSWNSWTAMRAELYGCPIN